MRSFLKNFKLNKKGATAIEYGLLASLIAVAAITGLGKVGTNLNTSFSKVSSKIV